MKNQIITMISKSELASLYGISLPTLRKRLEAVGMYDKNKRLFSPAELAEIFKILGKPKKGF